MTRAQILDRLANTQAARDFYKVVDLIIENNIQMDFRVSDFTNLSISIALLFASSSKRVKIMVSGWRGGDTVLDTDFVRVAMEDFVRMGGFVDIYIIGHCDDRMLAEYSAHARYNITILDKKHADSVYFFQGSNGFILGDENKVIQLLEIDKPTRAGQVMGICGFNELTMNTNLQMVLKEIDNRPVTKSS